MSKSTQGANSHLENLTSARRVHLTAAGTYVVHNEAGRLLRVILNTNGGTVTLRDGSEVIGIIAADAPEGTFDYGVYCDDNITVDLGNTGDVTVVFGD